jgi:formate/nitrite transporter FocA (FNT family)
MSTMKTSLARSAAAGILICMGCIVNLKVGGGIPGAVLFSAGLWFVVNFDAELFTGRVARDDYNPLQKQIMLVMNVIGGGICGYLASLFLPEIREAAQKIAAGYQDPVKVIWQSVMCGICMYLATTQPKNKDISRLPFVVYGVALFILSSYAHSIALAGYAAIARGIAWWVIPLAAAGNGVGSYGMKFLLAQKTHE